ncbi:MAG TPA: EamA family transporter [Actinomycetota bacterium]|nr:EamA family transporter [Actinomycetota bacterium]
MSSPAATRSATTGLLAIALAAALWAGAAVLARTLFDDGVEPILVAEARSIVAALGLLLIAAVAGRRRTDRSAANGPDRTSGRMLSAQLIALGLSIALVNAAYYVAIEHLPVAVAIVLQYTAPAIVVGWAALVARRRPGRDVIVALVAALSGVVLVSEVFLAGSTGSLDTFGVAMGLASAVLFATYTLLAERVTAVYGAVGAMRRAFLVASAFWLVVQVPQGWPEVLVAPDHVWRVLAIGVFGTLAPFLLYVWGMSRVAAERASIAATLEPVLAAAVAWLWLGQALGPAQIAGGMLVLGAVASLNAVPRRRRETKLPVG